MSNYAWIITADLINGDRVVPQKREGVVGPRDATDEQVARLNAGEGEVFQMLDSDGVVYYAGRFIGDVDQDGMAPLDDFGMPDAGASEIQYLVGPSHTSEWRTL